MKPALESIIQKAAEQCVSAAEDCLLTSNAVKKCKLIITEVVDKVAKDATLTEPEKK